MPKQNASENNSGRHIHSVRLILRRKPFETLSHNYKNVLYLKIDEPWYRGRGHLCSMTPGVLGR